MCIKKSKTPEKFLTTFRAFILFSFKSSRLKTAWLSHFHGFSTLILAFFAYLHFLYSPCQVILKIVKLDKTFVNNQNSKMWTILQNTVHMIKDLNMEIVVEGIETEEMVQKFSDLKCDFIQGYFFSKPIPQREFVEFIDRWNNRERVNA